MDTNQATDILWQSMQQNDHAPQALRNTLALGEAYQVQLGILDRLVSGGEKLSGWKIGGTSDAARQMLQLTEPVCGYLLASNHYPSGRTFDHAAIGKPVIESELCITFGEDMKGPGVTREQVGEGVSAITPAFEVVQMRSDMRSDLPLGVADDVAQWGIVMGTSVSPYPKDLDLGAIIIEMKKNGEVVQQAVGRDVIDDQLEALAWLANHLAEYGRGIEAGQYVMTGSCTKPTPIARGDTWETTFSSVGVVSASFV